MKRHILWAAAGAISVVGLSLSAQSVPEIRYDAVADALSLPSYGEVAGVATNSRGHVFVYARTGHAAATLGDERTFYHGGSRLFQFDQTGKFVKEIGQGVYAIDFAQQVRVDPQDNIWIVDAGSNQIVKFDADGRFGWCSDASPRTFLFAPARAYLPRSPTPSSWPKARRRRRDEAAVKAEAGAAAARQAPGSMATASTVRRMSHGIARATSTSPTVLVLQPHRQVHEGRRLRQDLGSHGNGSRRVQPDSRPGRRRGWQPVRRRRG